MAAFNTVLLNLLMAWTLATAAPGTTISYRALAQPLYQWGWLGQSGVGAGAALWVPVITAFVPWSIVLLARRAPVRLLSPLLLGWHTFLFVETLYASVTLGSRMTMRGDTFGVNVNVSLLAPVLCGLFLLLAVVWAVRAWNQPWHAAPWRPNVRVWIGASLLLSLAIFWLFSLHDGTEHHGSDRMAILLVIVQFFVAPQIAEPPHQSP